MILKKFNYSEFTDKPNAWSLDGLDLENINLLVGKNATGKTNTLTKIDWLGNMLVGRQPQLLISGEYDVKFTCGDDIYQYKLNLSLHNVEYEELIVNGEQNFERGKDGKGQIFTNQIQRKMDFQLSPNQLVVTSKRDAIQHPFLVELVKWAEGQKLYTFGSNMGKDTFCFANDIVNINVDPRDMNSVVGLYIKGEREFHQTFPKRIIDSMKSIGYELTTIGASFAPNILLLVPHVGNTNGLALYVCEKNSNATIFQPSMSQGMFRALSLIIQITFNTLKRLPTTIMIDDIGEGLDFERSTKLINMLIELAEKDNNIQLIMSTNDRFVMNNVPLKYWQIIQRDGGQCKVFNYNNSKEKFDEFQYTGLNNFDFLATDFINSTWESI
jgi:predicted ATPase